MFESSKDTPTNGATSNGGIIHLHHSRSESDPVVIKDKSGKKEEKLRTQQNEKGTHVILMYMYSTSQY